MPTAQDLPGRPCEEAKPTKQSRRRLDRHTASQEFATTGAWPMSDPRHLPDPLGRRYRIGSDVRVSAPASPPIEAPALEDRRQLRRSMRPAPLPRSAPLPPGRPPPPPPPPPP